MTLVPRRCLPCRACDAEASCTATSSPARSAARFARADIADSLSFNSPSHIHAGLVLGRCHAKLGQHSLSVAAFESSTQLAEEGRYLLSSVMSVRARAATGIEAGSAGAGAAAGHWSEATGKQRLADAVERMVGTGPGKAQERVALGAALLA